jgi:hypothetical protein
LVIIYYLVFKFWCLFISFIAHGLVFIFWRLFISFIAHGNDKECYGDMLFVDSTYKLNNYQYPCLIMAIKDNNNAYNVAAALMAYERKELMKELKGLGKQKNLFENFFL